MTPSGILVALCVGFLLAEVYRPLFHSNQNSYLLHALAASGWGHLDGDWLAGTRDAFPLSTWLARGVLAVDARGLYVLYAAFLVVYALALERLVRESLPRPWSLADRGLLAAAIVLLHSPLIRSEYHKGVAGQYLFAGYYQPCTGGVFLLASMALFVDGRVRTALLALALAASLHSSYLLSAAFLGLAYGVVLLRRGVPWSRLVAHATLLALLLTPAAVHALALSGSFTADRSVAATARQFLYETLIPYHARARLWLFTSTQAFVQNALVPAVLIAAGLWLFRRSPVRPLLAIPTGVALVLLVAQLASDDPLLGLAFPWRISVVVVPICSAALLAAVLRWARDEASRRGVAPARLTAALAGLVALAILLAAVRTARQRPPIGAATAVSAHARARRAADQLYAIPQRPPFEAFRVAAGVRVVADWKSHPYHPAELLEWKRRRAVALEIEYTAAIADCAALRRALAAAPVTHVVLETPGTPECPDLVSEFRDEHYTLSRVIAAAELGGRVPP